MSQWHSILVSEEVLVDKVVNLRLSLAFVPFGNPMVNVNPSLSVIPAKDGELILTNRRLILEWKDKKIRNYSTLAVYALSERFFDSALPHWPYQAILNLPGGISLMVETSKNDARSANELSQFLNKVLFSLGKRDMDFASMAAINAYLEQQRRRNSDSPVQTTTAYTNNENK